MDNSDGLSGETTDDDQEVNTPQPRIDIVPPPLFDPELGEKLLKTKTHTALPLVYFDDYARNRFDRQYALLTDINAYTFEEILYGHYSDWPSSALMLRVGCENRRKDSLPVWAFIRTGHVYYSVGHPLRICDGPYQFRENFKLIDPFRLMGYAQASSNSEGGEQFGYDYFVLETVIQFLFVKFNQIKCVIDFHGRDLCDDIEIASRNLSINKGLETEESLKQMEERNKQIERLKQITVGNKQIQKENVAQQKQHQQQQLLLQIQYQHQQQQIEGTTEQFRALMDEGVHFGVERASEDQQ